MSKLRIKRKNTAKQQALVNKPDNAVVYIRVSSEEQVKGFSLSGQEETCCNFADRNGYTVLKVFREEGQSAKTTKRDEFQKMMKFCKENKERVKYIIVYRIDRFTRNMCDLLTEEKVLEKIGVEILTATETNEKGYMGKFTRHINGLIAQLDNERRADATKNGMKSGFLKGNWMWKAPYGYYNDKNIKKIVPKPKESRTVKQIFKKMETGCYSQADIMSELKKENIIIKPNHLCEILRNPVYSGWMYKPEWNPEPVKGNFEAIISEKTFNAVQDILDGRKPVIAPHDFNNEDYPLKQFLKCPYCGKPLTGSNSISQRGKKLYQYYACYNKECPSKDKKICKSKFSISKDVAERNFIEILSNIKPKDEIIDLYKSIVKDVYEEQTHEEKIKNLKYQQELDEIENKKKRIADLLIDEKIDQNMYDLKIAEFIERENDIRANMQFDILIPQEFDKFLNNSLTIIQNLSNVWNNGVLRIKKNIQNLVFPNGLSADFSTFQNSANSTIFKQIGSLTEPYIDMVLPGEFESPSTP